MTLTQKVASAWKAAEENGYGDYLRGSSLRDQAVDLIECDADLENEKLDLVLEAVIDLRIREGNLTQVLNQVQYEELPHRLLDPVHAIQFALQADQGIGFLWAWNEGDWNTCNGGWPEWKEFRR